VDRVYFSTSEHSTTSFLKAGTYYRAEIRENGRIVEQLKGKYNSKEQLDDFLRRWPGDNEYHPIKTWESYLELSVWKYHGSRLVGKITHARMPRPFYCNFTN
jgi:hypothetical protein